MTLQSSLIKRNILKNAIAVVSILLTLHLSFGFPGKAMSFFTHSTVSTPNGSSWFKFGAKFQPHMLSVMAQSHAATNLQYSTSSTNGMTKLHELRHLASMHDDYVVRFNSTGYRHYALKQPRPYQLCVLFTALDPKLCDECAAFGNAFGRISIEYVRSGEYKRDEQTNKPAVVFGMIDLLQDKTIVNLHQLRSLPALVCIDSKTLQKSGKQILFKSDDLYQSSKGGPLERGGLGTTPDRTLEWINMKTLRTVEWHVGTQQKLINLGLLLSGLVVICYVGWKTVLLLRVYPILVAIGALLIHFLSVSGMFYSFQNGMIIFGYDQQTRQPITIAKSGRAQFMGEGLMMAAATICCGLCLLGMVYAPKWDVLKQLKKRLQAAVCFLGFVFIGLIYVLFGVYRYKTSWYMPTFFPPVGFISGPLRFDRGNEF